MYYEYEITLSDYIATVDHENDLVYLRNGLTCTYSQGKCLDSEDGYITWDITMNKKCEESEFEVIYEGITHESHQKHIYFRYVQRSKPRFVDILGLRPTTQELLSLKLEVLTLHLIREQQQEKNLICLLTSIPR